MNARDPFAVGETVHAIDPTTGHPQNQPVTIGAIEEDSGGWWVFVGWQCPGNGECRHTHVGLRPSQLVRVS